METSLLDSADEIFNGDYSNMSIGQSSMPVPTFPSSSTTSAASSPSAMNAMPNIAAAGGSILSGIGGYMQGQETAAADEYNAGLAIMKGQFQVEEIGTEETQTISTQKAMYAKAGVAMSGSVLDTALSTATQFEYSKEIATFNAQSQANMDNYEAKVAKSQGQFALASGLLSGAMDMAALI